MFITTANTLEGIPRPLLDRMEVLRLSGYSDAEKLAIARQYLLPRQQSEAGLEPAQIELDDACLHTIIRRYTREAGVRELERVIGRLARKRARQVVEGRQPLQPLSADQLADLLGPPRYHGDLQRPSLQPGVAAGLAWTEVGGEVLYVEATLAPKEEKVTLTGQLGEVMQESARAAKSHLWAHAEQLGLDREGLESKGVHIHVPQGAVPKDGPSAGITMATALISLFRGIPVKPDVCMTGELTLSGLVLPIGGVKEKVLAAHRAGFHTVILPKDNEADLTTLPDNVRAELQFVFVEDLTAVANAALKHGD
jgi:ATP-dependent Lon protease